LNQLTSESQANYTYDKNGNRTSKENIRYSYDALDRLICVSMPADTIKFKYDSFGRRIERTNNHETIQYLYQFETEIGATIDGNLCEFRAIYQQFVPFAIKPI